MKVHLTSLGCRLNEAELQTWSHAFSDLGIETTNQSDNANLIVVNTCAVTGEAARKSRQTIRKLHRKNATAKIVVTGCYASLEKQQAESILGVDLVVNNQDKTSLPQKAAELMEWDSMPYAATEPAESAIFNRNRERAFIKIQDGCRYRCTYCIVTIARGEEVSRTTQDIINEIRLLEQQGVKEIVLTGVHVGGYGTDLETDLYSLVKAILTETIIPRIRFASVEPWDLPESFFDLFSNKRLMPHMHLPIQSGSDQILKKMSRRCKSASFLKLIEKARSVEPSFNVTSDIIVGFPGESEQDFEQSKSMVAAAQFGHVHTFSYSKREGTKAAGLANQIDEQVKKHRSRALHKIANSVQIKVASKMVGQTCDVLWEGNGQPSENGYIKFYGYTPNYHKVCVEVEGSVKPTNQILSCRIDGIGETGLLYGTLVETPAATNQDIFIKHI
jgi:threonylcarbamoyladenosine tRNA methylthiotransferase MtaB